MHRPSRGFPFLVLSGLLAFACGDTEATKKPGEPAAAADKPAPAEKPAEADKPAEPEKPAEPAPFVVPGACDEAQTKISADADTRAAPWGIAKHLEKNFPDLKVSWLMKETPYQNFVVKTAAQNFGRCDDAGCYLFAAPTAVIDDAVKKSLKGDTHDPAILGEALGLPAKNFEGPLRMMTIDLKDVGCVRLPVDEDPGVWKCQTPEDRDCFKFGGYTSGGIPEVMVINAPVDKAEVKEIR